MARAVILFFLFAAVCMVLAQRRGQRMPNVTDTKRAYIDSAVRSADRMVMPASDKGPLKVVIGFLPRAVVDMDRNGYVDMLAEVHLTWTDPRLRGSDKMRVPLQNITSVSISTDAIWLPDIELASPGKMELLNHRLEAVVNPQTGDVVYVLYVKIRDYCDVIGQMHQGYVTCSLKFMSWTRAKSELDVQVGYASLEFFSITGPWNITQLTGTRNERVYGDYPLAYPDITFDYTIRGRVYYPG